MENNWNAKKQKKHCKNLYKKTINDILVYTGNKKISYKEWLEYYLILGQDTLNDKIRSLDLQIKSLQSENKTLKIIQEQYHNTDLAADILSENVIERDYSIQDKNDSSLKISIECDEFSNQLELKNRFKKFLIENKYSDVNSSILPFMLLGNIAELYEYVFNEKINISEIISKPIQSVKQIDLSNDKSTIMNQEIKRILLKYNLEGVDKPRLTPEHPTKKAIVLAKEGNVIKLLRFGDQNSGHNYSVEARKRFKARFKSRIAKGKLYAAYWSDKFLWSPGGHVKQPPKTQQKIFK
jgi:DNA-directed RNA polymerase subunit H (RpoH/RPB5)